MKLLDRIRTLETRQNADPSAIIGRPSEVYILPGETIEQAITRTRLEEPRLATGWLTIVRPDEPFTA